MQQWNAQVRLPIYYSESQCQFIYFCHHSPFIKKAALLVKIVKVSLVPFGPDEFHGSNLSHKELYKKDILLRELREDLLQNCSKNDTCCKKRHHLERQIGIGCQVGSLDKCTEGVVSQNPQLFAIA
jgi:hypothetical protein